MIIPSKNKTLTALWKSDIIRIGQIVWACDSKNATIYPQQGILCVDKFKHHPNNPQKYDLWCFVPLKPNGEPDWSNVCDVSTLQIATTKSECIQLFNQHIDPQIDVLKN